MPPEEFLPMASRRFLPNLLLVLVIAVIAAVAFTFLKDMDGPTITLTPNTGRVSPQTVLEVAVEDPSGIRELNVGTRKNNNFVSFFRKHYDGKAVRQVEQIPVKSANLAQGSFELEIRVTDASLAGFGQGNTRTEILPMRYDARAPRISVKTMPANVWRGGASAIRYTVDEEVVNTGVLIGGYFVPASPQADGSYVCIYPFPFTMSAPDFKRSVALTATDLAGNVTRTRFTVMAYERNFRHDKLTLTDDFLSNAMQKLHHLAPETTNPLQCYLTVNTRVRASNMETLRELNSISAKGKLWDGNFMALPRSAARANFADRRSLIYNGQQVSEAYHLGLDLASVRNADIPAANNGTVVYAAELGIYGNVVVIDHGLGVMTLYSHMSEIVVQKGQAVTKGTILGKTGTTGLAFGDHLHFGVVVGGLEVNPVEWIDAKWLANLTRRLSDQN